MQTKLPLHVLSPRALASLQRSVKLGATTEKAGRPAHVLTEPSVAAWYESNFRRSPEAMPRKRAGELADALWATYNSPGVQKTIGVNHFTIWERLATRAKGG